MKRVFSDQHRKNLSAAMTGKPGLSGDENPNWKGGDIGNSGIHSWIKRALGTPKYCAHCECTDAPMFDWANISGEYKRDPEDWLRLCRSCHMKFDHRMKMRKGKLITYRGETKNIKEWAEKLGIKYTTLYARLNTYKMTVEDAFNLTVSPSHLVRGSVEHA